MRIVCAGRECGFTLLFSSQLVLYLALYFLRCSTEPSLSLSFHTYIAVFDDLKLS